MITFVYYTIACSTNHRPAVLIKLRGVQVAALVSVTAMNLLTGEVWGSAQIIRSNLLDFVETMRSAVGCRRNYCAIPGQN